MPASSRIPWMIPFLLFLAAVAGCGGGDSRDSEGPPDAVDPDLQARLRALPYAGSTRVAPSDSGGVASIDRARTAPGLTFYVVQQLCLAELVDLDGRVVHRWSDPEDGSWRRAELLPGGDLLVIGTGKPVRPESGGRGYVADESRFLRRLDREGRSLWQRGLNAHHDVEVTPDGSLLLLGFRRRLAPDIDPEVPVRDDLILRLSPDGELLDEISLLDLARAAADAFPLDAARADSKGGAAWLDLFHVNSLEQMARPGLFGTHALYDPRHVLICLRHQDRIAIVDTEARRIVWSWGRWELRGPHDAQLLPDGNILIFDNGVGRRESRVVEMDPRRDEIVWSWRPRPPLDLYTLSKGSAQRLSNGNTLVAESDKGRILEVTSEGDLVWEFLTPHETGRGRRAAIVRARRVPADVLD